MMTAPTFNRYTSRMITRPITLQLLFLVGMLLHTTSAWTSTTTTTFTLTSFLGSSIPKTHQKRPYAALRMDTEQPPRHAVVERFQVSVANTCTMPHNDHVFTLPIPAAAVSGHHHHHADSIDEAARQYGMPWTSSIDPKAVATDDIDDDSTSALSVLTFMPFWKWQVGFMKQHLTNLRVLPLRSELAYAESSRLHNGKPQQRIYTLTCTSDEYKYIRLTVLDAGKQTQVFTSVWYPDPARGPDLPILGCDLLQFHQKRHVCICDFQPLISRDTAEKNKDNNNNNKSKYAWEDLLEPIRSQYKSLQQPMSGRFYNPADMFFSNQMLLARCNVNDNGDSTANASNDCSSSSQAAAATKTLNDAHDMILGDFMPAWQQYVQQHVQLVKSTPRQSAQIPVTLQQHASYDTYAAVRDPAHGLLAASFGKDFAEQYVYEVLFPLSERPSDRTER